MFYQQSVPKPLQIAELEKFYIILVRKYCVSENAKSNDLKTPNFGSLVWVTPELIGILQ